MSLRTICIALSALIWTGFAAGADPISLSNLPSCGSETVQARDCPDCAQRTVFVRPDYWHGLYPCLRDMRNAWRRSGPMTPVDMPGQPAISDLTRSQILFEMGQDHTRFTRAGSDKLLGFADVFAADLTPRVPLDRMELVNDRGLPYNGMGQSGLGYMLYDLSSTAVRGGYDRAAQDAAFYRLLGRASFRTILTNVPDGGLAAWQPCEEAPSRQCVWFYSVTRRDLKSVSGATLNQMLHVVRDLGLAANVLAREGWVEPFDLEGAASAGLDQLVLGAGYAGPGSAPDLADFATLPDEEGAWAYYGFDTTKPKAREPGYFLDDPKKNCSYHLHVLDLIRQISEWAEAHGRSADALKMIAAKGGTVDRFRAAATEGTALPQVNCAATTLPDE